MRDEDLGRIVRGSMGRGKGKGNWAPGAVSHGVRIPLYSLDSGAFLIFNFCAGL